MIEVRFINESKETTTNPIYQWDYGQQLYIYGLNSTDATIQVRLGYWLCEKNYCKSKQLIMWLLFSVCHLNKISWFNNI